MGPLTLRTGVTAKCFASPFSLSSVFCSLSVRCFLSSVYLFTCSSVINKTSYSVFICLLLPLLRFFFLLFPISRLVVLSLFPCCLFPCFLPLSLSVVSLSLNVYKYAFMLSFIATCRPIYRYGNVFRQSLNFYSNECALQLYRLHNIGSEG